MQEEKDQSFLDHLEELRWRIIYSAIAILVMAIVCFVMKSWIFDHIILAPKSANFISYRVLCQISEGLSLGGFFCFEEFNFLLQNVSMSGQISTHIVVSIIGGIVVSFPFVATQSWLFLKPGLNQKEIKATRGIVFYSSFLFLLGVSFGYFLIAPLSVQFLGGYQVSEEVVNQITLNSFITTITSTTLASGIIFQLPIVIYFLSKLGIVTPAFLKKYRKHALVVVLIISAIITPPDMMSQVLVTLPVMLLYEISIMVSRRIQKQEGIDA